MTYDYDGVRAYIPCASASSVRNMVVAARLHGADCDEQCDGPVLGHRDERESAEAEVASIHTVLRYPGDAQNAGVASVT